MVLGRIPKPCYGRVYKEGRWLANRYLVLYYREDPLPVRLGIVASKRLGKACVRNRVKRRIRECFRQEFLPLIKPRGEFVFIARQRAALCSYQELVGAMKHLLKRMGLLE